MSNPSRPGAFPGDLTRFVEYCRKQGVPIESVRKALLSTGLEREKIRKTLSKFGIDVTQTNAFIKNQTEFIQALQQPAAVELDFGSAPKKAAEGGRRLQRRVNTMELRRPSRANRKEKGARKDPFATLLVMLIESFYKWKRGLRG